MLFLHMSIIAGEGDEAFLADFTLVWFLLVPCMSEVMSSPIAGKLQTLLFIANLANRDKFYIGVIEILNVL